MPPFRSSLRLVFALALLLCAASAHADEAKSALPNWQAGLFLSTYSGPSHEDLLTHINEYMDLFGDNTDSRFSDFEVGTPVALRMAWNQQPRISYTLTYYYSSYSTVANFVFSGWPSARSVDTNLHEIAIALNYGLNFMRSDRISPYLGLGLDLFYADSELSIALNNPSGGGDALPDQYFSIPSQDMALGALAFAGLTYHFSNRIAMQAEMQGVMGQVRQNFDYDGSFQYVNPDGELPDHLPNDVLLGAYQLNLNGLRLALGLLFGF